MSASREEEFFKSLIDNYKFEASRERWATYFKVFGRDAIFIRKMGKKYKKYDANLPYLISCIRLDQIEDNKLKEGERVKFIKFNLDKINDDDFQNVLRNGNFEIFDDKDNGSLDNNMVEDMHIIPKEMGKYALTSKEIKQDAEPDAKPDATPLAKPEEKGKEDEKEKEETKKIEEEEEKPKSNFKLIDKEEEEEEQEEEIKRNIKYRRKRQKKELDDDDDDYVDDIDEEYILDRQEDEDEEQPLSLSKSQDALNYSKPLSSYRGEDSFIKSSKSQDSFFEYHVSNRINASPDYNMTKSSLSVQAPGKKQSSFKPKMPTPSELEPYNQNSEIMERLESIERTRYKQAGEIKRHLIALNSLKTILDNILTSNTTNQKQLNESLQLINSNIKDDRKLYNDGFDSMNKKMDDNYQGITSKVSDLSGNVSALSSQIGNLAQKPTPTIQNNVYIPKEGMDVINSNVQGALQEKLSLLSPIIEELKKGISEIDRVSKQIVEYQQKPTRIEEPDDDDDDDNYDAQFDSVNKQLTTLNTSLSSILESVGNQLLSLYNNIDDRLTKFTDNISRSFSDTAQSLSTANASRIQTSEDRVKEHVKTGLENALTIICKGFESLPELMKPTNDNINSVLKTSQDVLQVGKDNQTILKSNNSAISNVSTTTGQIMDKANENNTLITNLIKAHDKIEQEIQTLATYSNNSTDKADIIKAINDVYSKLEKSKNLAKETGNKKLIALFEAQNKALDKIYDQQNKYYEELKLIEDRKAKEKAERRRQKDLQRQQEREEEDKRYNNIMNGINTIKQEKQENQEEEEKPLRIKVKKPYIKPKIGSFSEDKSVYSDNEEKPIDMMIDEDEEEEEKITEDETYSNMTEGIWESDDGAVKIPVDNSETSHETMPRKASRKASQSPSQSLIKTTIIKDKNNNNNISLLVELQKLTNGNITSEEIGQIQDLDGKLTEMNDEMEELTEGMKIATESGNNEGYNNLKVRYDKLKQDYIEQVAELSKKIYNLSKNKRKTKATFATHEYLMSRINKL